MTAYGRKQPFGLSLNRPSLTSAFGIKADIQARFGVIWHVGLVNSLYLHPKTSLLSV